MEELKKLEKKINNKFKKSEDLSKFIITRQVEIENKIDNGFKHLEEKMDKQYDNLFSKMDEMVKLFKDTKGELLIVSARQRDHEDRLSILEG